MLVVRLEILLVISQITMHNLKQVLLVALFMPVVRLGIFQEIFQGTMLNLKLLMLKAVRFLILAQLEI